MFSESEGHKILIRLMFLQIRQRLFTVSVTSDSSLQTNFYNDQISGEQGKNEERGPYKSCIFLGITSSNTEACCSSNSVEQAN